MIRYVKGDIFETECQTLVNPVNTAGVMGAGLAEEFARRYPGMVGQYECFCRLGALRVGTLWVYRGAEKWVLCFPTKKDWRDSSKLEYIEAGLENLVDTYETRGIVSIAIPKIGCGLGGLSWDAVRELIEMNFSETDLDVQIYGEVLSQHVR